MKSAVSKIGHFRAIPFFRPIIKVLRVQRSHGRHYQTFMIDIHRVISIFTNQYHGAFRKRNNSFCYLQLAKQLFIASNTPINWKLYSFFHPYLHFYRPMRRIWLVKALPLVPKEGRMMAVRTANQRSMLRHIMQTTEASAPIIFSSVQIAEQNRKMTIWKK